MWSGRSASAGSRRIHGLSPSTSKEIMTAHRAPFFHLIGRSMRVFSLGPRHVQQKLRVGAHPLANVRARDALVVAMDALELVLFEYERTEAVTVKPAAPEHPVVGEGDQDHRRRHPARRP